MITARYALTQQSILQTLLLVEDYRRSLRERGYNDGCWTYRGLRYHLYYRYQNKSVEWHTVERTLRKLAEEGLLRRREIRRRKRVLFCATPEYELLVQSVMELRRRVIEGSTR